MNNYNERTKRLIEYVKGIQKDLNGAQLYLKYKEDIEQVKPQEAFEIFHTLLQEGIEAKEILVFLDKVINVFYKSLSSYKWEKPKNDRFLMDLMQENKALVKKTEDIKDILKEEQSLTIKKEKLLPRIDILLDINHHYLKKENILFPYLEKTMEKFEGLSIMWALHEEVKKQIKEVIEILRDSESDEIQINEAIGNMFFGILGVLKKEELILFPSACEVLSPKDWYEMHRQSLEYGFSFIEKPGQELEKQEDSIELIKNYKEGYVFKTETGVLDFQQMLMIFNALPVDLTFVDEYNKVRFFTRPKDRIFPRSPAIIGREVKNCHPPDSVDIVEEIIERFRSNAKDSATFWIQVKNRTIMIQYFALRDPNGNYRGTLEVSQDISEIKKLEGERRILDWE